jgi:hypothetical protein
MPFNARALLEQLFPPETAANPSAAHNDGPTIASRPVSGLADWEARWRRAPQLVEPPHPCGWCGSTTFWRSVYAVYVCANCHPPAYPALVEAWLRLIATEDGPTLVRLRSAPPTRQ